MTGYTLAQAKRDFSLGFVGGFGIERAPMGSGWFALVKVSGQRFPLADARTKQPRQFKTLDAAVSALEAVGFKVDSLRA